MRQLNAKSVTCKMRKVGGVEPVIEFLVKDRYEEGIASVLFEYEREGRSEIEKEKEKNKQRRRG